MTTRSPRRMLRACRAEPSCSDKRSSWPKLICSAPAMIAILSGVARAAAVRGSCSNMCGGQLLDRRGVGVGTPTHESIVKNHGRQNAQEHCVIAEADHAVRAAFLEQ